jgi:hypothetical protein
MSSRNFSVRLVVRQSTRTGLCFAGLASNLPKISKDYRDIASYGRWFGCQMSYRPFRQAQRDAVIYASYCNGLAAGLAAGHFAS